MTADADGWNRSARARVRASPSQIGLGLLVAVLLAGTAAFVAWYAWEMRPRPNTSAPADEFIAIADSFGTNIDLDLLTRSERRTPSTINITKTWRYPGSGSVCDLLAEPAVQDWLDRPQPPEGGRFGGCSVDGHRSGTTVQLIDSDCYMIEGARPGDKCVTLHVFGKVTGS